MLPYGSKYLLKGSVWGIIYHNLEAFLYPAQTVAMDPYWLKYLP